jgi:hypothetical protein
MLRSSLIAIALLGLCWAAPAAEPKVKPKGNDVSGTLTLDGKPLADAMVALHPADPTKKPYQGRTDTDGKFRIAGVPAGEYGFTAMKVAAKGDVGAGRNLLPPRYADPAKSGITVTVRDGANQADIQLISKGR